jgi:hypothetical protein
MTIIQILKEMGVLLLCSFIQMIGVFVEGLSKLFAKSVDGLEVLNKKLVGLLDKKEEKRKTINVPL